MRLSRRQFLTAGAVTGATLVLPWHVGLQRALAQATPTLDPTTIDKFVTPLVIPPAMPRTATIKAGTIDYYVIAVVQFLQQILPTTLPRTRVWSYQLETTDHLHLGQVVTFAAGLEVSAVIWITTKVSEEHRAVLDWLNQHGDDEVRFFAVELRLLRIGNSLPAAVFNVAAKPNDWQKVARQRQRVSSPFNSRTREF
jgi:hypothetical protein